MAHLARNYASEAKIKCPKCDTSEKGRKLKIHIKGTHKLLCLYTCTFPISEGQICNFACGKSLSCFIHHQEKRHHISFADGAEHKFTTENYFAFGLKPIVKDVHTPACDVERKSFKTTSQAKVNLKQSQKRAEAKIVRQAAASIKRAAVAAEKAAAAATARRVKAESLAARKRKASCSDAKRPAKRAKKCYVEETPTNNALVLVNSTPVGNSVFAVELPNAMEYVGGGTQPEEGVKKPENENDDEATEAFFRYCYAEQEVSDDETEDGDDKTKNIIPKKVDDKALLYTAGRGRFSADVRELCKGAVAEMKWKSERVDAAGWRLYIRRLGLRWHPDKNSENAAKAQVVFQCCQNQQMKLERDCILLD